MSLSEDGFAKWVKYGAHEMMPDDSPFWMVWNPAGRPPAFKHINAESAMKEAERLARLNPGERFYVLQAVAMRTVDAMVRVNFQQPNYDPDTPF